MQYGCRTDIGCVRKRNEDAYALLQQYPNAELLIVADGMGGHKSGDIASKMAVDTIRNHLEGKELSIPLIRAAIESANRDIYERALQDEDCSGMGTTLVLAMIETENVLIANVGDSRAYHFNYYANEIKQVTTDHSLVQELLYEGKIELKDVGRSPYQNVITRSLGSKQRVDIDFFEVEWDTDDCVLLCSDGLTRYISETILRKKLSQDKSIQQICDDLVNMAKQAGGQDNITVALVKNAQGGEAL